MSVIRTGQSLQRLFVQFEGGCGLGGSRGKRRALTNILPIFLGCFQLIMGGDGAMFFMVSDRFRRGWNLRSILLISGRPGWYSVTNGMVLVGGGWLGDSLGVVSG